ncbi:MAG: sensor histidine kinase, partial [Syntrophothermus sp.]
LQSEIERQNLQARIDYLIKNANDVIILSDDNGRIIQANDKAVLIYGYSLKEFCDLTIDSIRAEHTRALADSDREKVKENDGYIFETVHIKKGGTPFPVEVSSRIIEVEGKKYFQSLIRDITERKSYEERLTKTISELNRSNKDLEQFAYVASHDLQEPLRMVHTFSQLLNKNNFDKLDDNSKKYIGFLTEGAQRMQQLIQALLTYSRLNASSDCIATVNCNEALKDALENLKLKIEESRARIISPLLPTINAYPSQIVQLFQNLLSNAIKYRSMDNPEIRIKVEEGPEEWLFSIHDNGIGISSEYFEKIFLIFQRLNDRNNFEGTGIGLTICKRIVERHGGRIWVESEPGKGSVFHFSIKKL